MPTISIVNAAVAAITSITRFRTAIPLLSAAPATASSVPPRAYAKRYPFLLARSRTERPYRRRDTLAPGIRRTSLIAWAFEGLPAVTGREAVDLLGPKALAFAERRAYPCAARRRRGER